MTTSNQNSLPTVLYITLIAVITSSCLIIYNLAHWEFIRAGVSAYLLFQIVGSYPKLQCKWFALTQSKITLNGFIFSVITFFGFVLLMGIALDYLPVSQKTSNELFAYIQTQSGYEYWVRFIAFFLALRLIKTYPEDMLSLNAFQRRSKA